MGLDERLSLDTYRACLTAFRGVLAPTEALLRQRSTARPGSWVVEPRAAFAEADLRKLPLPVNGSPLILPVAAIEAPAAGAEGDAASLGYAYVLEGSAIGAGSLLARVTAELPGAASSFLSHASSLRWQPFVSMLNERLDNEGLRVAAAEAAASLFDAFTTLIKPPRR